MRLSEHPIKLYPVNDVQYLLFNGPDLISHHLRQGKQWEDFLIQILKNFLQNISNPVFLDVGANLGAVTIPIAKTIQNRSGKVYSFEAQRGVFYQLCGNIFANDLTNVCHAYHIAIGNMDGTIELPILDLANEKNIGSLSIDPEIRKQQNTLSTSTHKMETVQLKPLDLLSLPKVDLIKIDVEGLELEVLQGAQNLLKDSNYPPILFEVWNDYMSEFKTKRETLFKYIHSLGYETLLIDELCIAQHPSNKYFDLTFNDTIKHVDMKRLK